MKLSSFSTMSPKAAIFGLALFAFLVSTPASAGTIYAVGQVGSSFSLYTINTSTGAATLIGATDDPNGSFGVAFDGGVLYAMDHISGLGTIDPASGAFTPIVTIQPYNTFGLALDTDTGTLYSTGNGYLLTISPSGAESVVASGDFGGEDGIYSLAYDPQDNVLYGLKGNEDLESSLYTIDPSTGAATLVGSTGIRVQGHGSIAFDALNDTLYFEDGWGDQLYTLDPSDGAPTLVGSLGLTDASFAMADVPTPEPNTLLLLCTGLAALAGLGWRRAGGEGSVS